MAYDLSAFTQEDNRPTGNTHVESVPYEEIPLPEEPPEEYSHEYAHSVPESSNLNDDQDDDNPLFRPPSAPETPERLYGWPLGQTVKVFMKYTEAHPMAVYLSLLSLLGIHLANGPYMLVSNERVNTNLYTLIVGDSSVGKKGTSWSNAMLLCSKTPLESYVIRSVDSGEGLIRLLDNENPRENPKKNLVYLDEFGALLRKSKNESSTLLTNLRTAWASAPLENRTKSSDSIRADNYRLGIVGHITPGELSRLITRDDIDGGTLNRFMVCHSHYSKLLPDGGNLPHDLREQLTTQVLQVVELAQKVKRVKRDEEANKLWNDIYLAHHQNDDRSEVVKAATDRSLPQQVRLQVLLTALNGSDVVTADTVQAAYEIVSYSEQTNKWLFDGPAENAATMEQKALYDFIKAAGVDGVSRNDIRRDLYQNHKSGPAVDPVINALIKRGLIKTSITPTKGRPKTVYTTF